MIRAKCENCGGTFRLDDSLAGKRAKCKRCGSVFTIPDADPFDRDTDPLPIAGLEDDPLPLVSYDQTANAPEAMAEDKPYLLSHAARPEERARAGRSVRDTITDPTRSFWSDAAVSFVVPFRGSSAFLFGFVVLFKVMYAVLDYALIIGWLGQIIIGGWLCSYYFLVIQSTCMGDDHLPRFEIEGGILGFVLPALRYLGTVLWAGLPFLVWSVIIQNRVVLSPVGDVRIWFGLLGLALFIWPMTILSVAIQGFTMDVLRYDKQLLTIGRSFLSYIAICGMLALLIILMAIAMGFGLVLGFGGIGSGLAARGVVIFLDAYTSVTTMRLIGLFYRHNKHRFAWLAE